MSKTCHPAPTNKKEYISEVGKILVRDYGKKKYYKPEEIKKASKERGTLSEVAEITAEVIVECWAMSVFSSHEDFDTYHRITGEACDYVAMKTEMLSGLALNSSPVDWISIPDIDLDASWLDFGDVFEGILEGIGDFIGGIADFF